MILVQRSLCNRSIRNESMRTDLFKPHIAFTNALTASRDVRALDVRALCSTRHQLFAGSIRRRRACEARVLNTGWDRRM